MPVMCQPLNFLTKTTVRKQMSEMGIVCVLKEFGLQ